MKKIKNNNSGFTLVELIIAMAVLAFLMTAIGSLMGSSIASHKKQKAEIQVHTSAQETYNQITDSIMQANEIVLAGYEVSSPYNFAENAANVGATPDLVYYVKNEEMKDFIKDNPSVFGTDGAVAVGDSNIKLFTDFDPTHYLYVTKMAIMTSVPIDITAVEPRDVLILGTDRVVLNDNLADGGSGMVEIDIKTTPSGIDAYTEYDNLVHIYTFEGSNMYYERQYSFMTTLNDMIDPAVSGSKESCIYNEGLSYVSTSGTGAADISGCAVTIDANNGAIGVDLMFNSKNMTYTTNGMINIRNSYVLKGKDN